MSDVRRSVLSAHAVGRRLGVLVVLLVLAALPWILDTYLISTASRILAIGLLAMSVNLLTGITGLPVLGQAAYFGVGAYTAAIVATSWTQLGLVQLVCAAAAATVVAVVTGSVAARARGVPFLMITLAIGELAYAAATRLSSITRGTDGYSGIPPVVPFPGIPELRLDGLVYYYVLVCFLLLFAVTLLLVSSPFGLALRGIRDNEPRLRSVGYDTTRYVVVAYSLAGALAGAGGSLWTSIQRFVSPDDLGFEVSALVLLAAVVGGLGSMWGSVVGAAVVVLTRDYLGGIVAGHGTLLLGALFIIAVYLLPGGVAGLAGRVRRLWTQRRAPLSEAES